MRVIPCALKFINSFIDGDVFKMKNSFNGTVNGIVCGTVNVGANNGVNVGVNLSVIEEAVIDCL